MKKVNNLKLYKGCLIIVDMVNGFVREGALHDEEIARVIPRQIELIKEAKAAGKARIFIKDTHDENATEFDRFEGQHCVRGTEEAEIVDELKPFVEDEDTFVFEKNSTNFMEAPTIYLSLESVLACRWLWSNLPGTWLAGRMQTARNSTPIRRILSST